MKRQNDWYTGINHYDNYKEKEILIEKKIIETPGTQSLHEQVKMIYILSGEGVMEVNGCRYQAVPGCLFCLYSHHFYHIAEVQKKITAVVIGFHIGLFMYMSWEKHPKHANARLVYDTRPVVMPAGRDRDKVETLVLDLLEEKERDRFEQMNMIEYKTLELHAYFCRFAYEEIGAFAKQDLPVFNVILKIVLATGEEPVLEDAAQDLGLSPFALNRQIKEACGYTFFQLKQFGKTINACALLHFPELSMEYISGLLGFSSLTSFYRVFKHYCGMTPRQYQENCIGNADAVAGGGGIAMQFLQYMHMHFSEDLKLSGLCAKFCIKPYTARQIFSRTFGRTFEDILAQIRVCYACAFLSSGKKSVLEISSLCGFESMSTFTRQFRRCMHQLPSQYREMTKL